MIKAILFDLDNTLLDFISVKEKAVDAAILAMIEAGLDIKPQLVKKDIFNLNFKIDVCKLMPWVINLIFTLDLWFVLDHYSHECYVFSAFVSVYISKIK